MVLRGRRVGIGGVGMSRSDVSLEISSPYENLAAVATPIRRVGVAGVQPDVLVEVAWIAERTPTDGTLKRLVSGMSPHVDRESVATRVPLPAERADVTPVGRRPKTS